MTMTSGQNDSLLFRARPGECGDVRLNKSQRMIFRAGRGLRGFWHRPKRLQTRAHSQVPARMEKFPGGRDGVAT